MPIDALIFDLDGTLLDTNRLHARAWVASLERHGYAIPIERVQVEMGKGGDLLVPAVLGPRADAEHGESLRQGEKDEYARLAEAEGIAVFPGAEELLRAARARGLRTALATSSGEEQLDAAFAAAGVDFRELVDVVTTADDSEASKPEPDIVAAACRKLGVSPAQAAMVGDTVYDAEACRRAGVVCLGVLCGGAGALALRAAGVRGLWRDPAHLVAELEAALRRAAPGALRLDRAALDRLMDTALAAAHEGLESGEVPIGAALFRGDGELVARGWNRMAGLGSKTAHAEMVAFGEAAGRVPLEARDLILVSTLEPCVMCTGAAIEASVDAIVYGLGAPPDAGTTRVSAPSSPESIMPRIVGGVRAGEARALLESWLDAGGGTELQRRYVTQLLASEGGG